MATVVFDLDGTLADTSVDLLAAANAVFRDWGHGDVLSPARADDRGTAMKGGRAMLRLGLARVRGEVDEALVELGYQPLLDAYAGRLSAETRLFPGAHAALERLRAGGHVIAVCTNKPVTLAEALLADLGVRDLFAALVGAGTLPVRKPDPAPLLETVVRAGGVLAQTVLIGDTVTDRDTARAAGTRCLLVTFGPDGQAVAGLEPDGLLHHFDQTEDSLAALGLV